jgi:putative transposase
MQHPWLAVDHDGEVMEFFAATERDRAAALKFIKRALERSRVEPTQRHDALRRPSSPMLQLGASKCRP